MNSKPNIITDHVTIDQINDCKDFNDAIDMARAWKHMTRGELANRLGYSYKHVSEVFKHEHNKDMTIKFAKRLEKVFGIDSVFWLELYINKYHRD